jgi:hypothetical protein
MMTGINELVPILVSGYGRSGTTALMALLGTDSRVAMGRAYPFEARPLSYAAKLALLFARNAPESHVPGERLFAFEDCGLGTPPWLPPGSTQTAPGDIPSPTAQEWFQHLWTVFAVKFHKENSEWKTADPSEAQSYHSPLTTHHSPAWHAEKVAAWVSPFVRLSLPARTLYLFRDPRDMYLSSNALMRERKYFSFGRGPADSDLDHARNLAYEFLLYFENYRADKDRADCRLVQYGDLVKDLAGVAGRLENFAGVQCRSQAMPQQLDFHRTASSPALSIDRWRREPLPDGVLRYLETYLQESFGALGYEFSEMPRACPGIEFAAANDSNSREQYGNEIERNQNGLHIALDKSDFEIDLSIDPIEARSFAEIWISLHGPGIEQVSLSWQTAKRSYSARRRLSLPWYGARHWRVLRFPVGRHERWHGEITGLRLELKATAQPGQVAHLRWLRLVE